MAHYLPVLMHSVTANVNAVPDDSSLETQATGQVDYLSHEWREEDVWRSWRNMTRQKNEIANGMRLENASWRTWWKQRNKLKTINPETLNWLKDSDVTWLYGPLHTAVQWTPPPRPTRDETERKPASAHDRLDLSMPKYKSILKYRSISELLTSELPTSPVFSPAESETEGDATVSDNPSLESRRLSLVHTKSDTHITRWGPDRSFRKDSPPRIEPPGSAGASSAAESSTVDTSAPPRTSSSTNLTGYFTTHVPGQQSNNASSSSNSNSASASPRATSSELSNTHAPKKKHITFNTFVEQCIAIDKPKPTGTATGKGTGHYYDTDEEAEPGDDDGYDEDVEGGDELDGEWGLNECAITDSDSDYEDEIFIQDEDDDEDEEEDEPTHGDNGVIEMRTSRQTKDSKRPSLRSKSKASTSSSSSADSCASSSTSGSMKKRRTSVSTLPRRRRSGTGADPLLRRGSNATARPSFSHSLSRHSSTSSERQGSQHVSQMVTIAPIAPTILKTGSSNYAHPAHYPAWDGFGVHPDRGSGLGDWIDGFGDDALSDDGGFGGPMGKYNGQNGWRSSESDQEESLGTPVELVYVPPPSGRYGSSYGGRSPHSLHSSQTGGIRINSSVNGAGAEVELMEEADEARRLGRSDDEVQVKRTHSDSQLQPTAEGKGVESSQPDGATTTASTYDATRESDKKSKRRPTSDLGSFGPSLPVVVRTPPAIERPGRGSGDEVEEDAYDYFGGPDLGGDYSTRRNPNRRSNKATEIGRNGSSSSLNEERKSRSRSRTPSPQSATPAIAVPGQPPLSPGSPALLSPPLRGRGAHGSGFADSSSRGRSSTRTSSSSLSDRERPRSRSNHSSPIGSLSPDGSGIGLNYGVYATGRIGDRDRERDRPTQRTGGRGRERTERRLSHSLSPDVDGVTASPAPSLPSTPLREVPPSSPSVQSTSDTSEGSSSVSSSQTIVPSSPTSTSRQPIDEATLPSVPTNTPVISISGAAHAIARMDNKDGNEASNRPIKAKLRSPPIDITQPHMSSPKTSYSVDPSPITNEASVVPRDTLVEAPAIRKSTGRSDGQDPESQLSRGPDGPIVGKAAGIMSSARAYLGLWSGGDKERSDG